ncbi:MAG: ATP synthase F1 subunit delta [Thermosynechococcaceae cyanobacterium]
MKQSAASAGMIEPYAEALMSLAQSHDVVDEFGHNANRVLEVLKTSADLGDALVNPFVKADIKKQVLRQILESELHPYFFNFLMVLIDRRRVFLLEGICRQYRVLLRKLKNTVLAEVTSTLDLSDEQRQSIVHKVREMTGAAEVELDTKIDRDLIGGVIVKVGSQVLDASIKGQLRRIGVSLLNANA